MTYRKPLSRRQFLRGAKGIVIGLPFLEAMLPALASAATNTPRLVAIYGGVPTYFGRTILPVGALTGSLISPISSLANVKQHVSVLLNMSLPLYAKGATPPPGGCLQQQHYTAPAPLLAGMTTLEQKSMLYQCHTVDQVFADAYGQTTAFKSIQARVQASGYGYGASGGVISSRFVGGVTNTLSPIESPLALYNKLFSNFTAPNPNNPSPAPQQPSSQLLNKKSVLDLVLADANKLISSLSGADKVRMEQHFYEIREIEKRIQNSLNINIGAPPVVTSASCVKPSSPPADPAVQTAIGGWSSETIRGDLMADLLAMAMACDLTRAISWQLTFDQCGLGSTQISGINKDLHQISHDVNNDGTLKPVMEQHLNWHCARFARLVEKLSTLQEGTGSVLDNSFIGMGFGEGVGAHNRDKMHMFIAGNKSAIKLGQCIDSGGEHPARMWIAGLNSLGQNISQLGQISQPMQSILK